MHRSYHGSLKWLCEKNLTCSVQHINRKKFVVVWLMMEVNKMWFKHEFLFRQYKLTIFVDYAEKETKNLTQNQIKYSARDRKFQKLYKL